MTNKQTLSGIFQMCYSFLTYNAVFLEVSLILQYDKCFHSYLIIQSIYCLDTISSECMIIFSVFINGFKYFLRFAFIRYS